MPIKITEENEQTPILLSEIRDLMKLKKDTYYEFTFNNEIVSIEYVPEYKETIVTFKDNGLYDFIFYHKTKTLKTSISGQPGDYPDENCPFVPYWINNFRKLEEKVKKGEVISDSEIVSSFKLFNDVSDQAFRNIKISTNISMII